MKELLLMRHAKSSWDESNMPDQERPLNKRGEKDAPRMGKLLKKEELVPEQILSSPALRARATAEAVAEKLNYDKPIVYIDQLYLGEAEDYFAALQQVPDDTDTVLVIGHNPGLETIVQLLSGEVVALPTGAVAYIKLPIKKWSILTADIDGHLKELWRPKETK